MKYIYIIFLSLISFSYLHAQKQDNFTSPVRFAKGDLNNDGINDKIEVKIDTISRTLPLRMQVFFGQKNKTYKLFFSSTTIIDPLFPIDYSSYPIPYRGKRNPNQIPNVYIEEGKLIIETYISGNAQHKFQFKNGKFQLVHFDKVKWTGKTIIETDFNLLTGKYKKQYEILETHNILKKVEHTIKINPLPTLKNFKPFQFEM